jgi:hypothetical protein
MRNPNTKCFVCKKDFYRIPSQLKFDTCCSSVCMGLKKKGKPQDKLFVKPYRLQKGNIPWNKGNGRAIINCGHCNKKISIFTNYKTKYCSRACSNQGLRLDDSKLSYATLHNRVKECYGKPLKCENCGTTTSKKFEWANISRNYNTLDRSDWARLCCRCHRRYDVGTKNKIEVLTCG